MHVKTVLKSRSTVLPKRKNHFFPPWFSCACPNVLHLAHFWSKSASVSTWNDLWTSKNNRKFSTSVDGSEIRRSPVEVGSFIPLCTGFFYIPGGAGFLPSIVSKIMTLNKMWCGMMWFKICSLLIWFLMWFILIHRRMLGDDLSLPFAHKKNLLF